MASPSPTRHQLSPLTASDDEPQTQPDSSTEKESIQEAGPVTDFGPPPDGGLEAWAVVAGGFCAVFASFGWINCEFDLVRVRSRVGTLTIVLGIGIFQDYYEHNQLKAYSSSTVAWIPSVESFMMFFWVCQSPAILIVFYSEQ